MWPEPSATPIIQGSPSPLLTLHSQVGRGRGGTPQTVARDAGVLPRIFRLHPEDDQGPINQDPNSQLQVTLKR